MGKQSVPFISSFPEVGKSGREDRADVHMSREQKMRAPDNYKAKVFELVFQRSKSKNAAPNLGRSRCNMQLGKSLQAKSKADLSREPTLTKSQRIQSPNPNSETGGKEAGCRFCHRPPAFPPSLENNSNQHNGSIECCAIQLIPLFCGYGVKTRKGRNGTRMQNAALLHVDSIQNVSIPSQEIWGENSLLLQIGLIVALHSLLQKKQDREQVGMGSIARS